MPSKNETDVKTQTASKAASSSASKPSNQSAKKAAAKDTRAKSASEQKSVDNSQKSALKQAAKTYIQVRQTRSLIGRPQSQRLTVRGLGLRGIGKQVCLPDTAAIRGMVRKVQHLLDIQVRKGDRPITAGSSLRGVAKATTRQSRKKS